MDIVRASTFWHDLKSILDHFDEVHAEESGLRFADAVDETIDFIRTFPDLGSPWESSRPRRVALRFQLIKGFENYVLLYRREEQVVYFLRLVHGSHDVNDL